MDATDLLRAEAELLLEQSSERLKEIRVKADLPKDSLLSSYKAALATLQNELHEERAQRLSVETQFLSLQSHCESLQTSLSTLQSQFDQSLRSELRKRENEIRDQCALREAQLVVELKTAVRNLEEELTLQNKNEDLDEELQREKEKTRKLEMEIEELKVKLRSEMEKRLKE